LIEQIAMARPLRIEFENACYHVTTRGNQQAPIFLSDADFELFLETLANIATRMNWRVHGYVLMNNHFHLVLSTPEANLSRGMRDLNGMYTQAFNRRRGRSGHVFQGRYKAILVDSNRYLAELSRLTQCVHTWLLRLRNGAGAAITRLLATLRCQVGLASRLY
jgi:putative transposase